jgi:hypothetical protein
MEKSYKLLQISKIYMTSFLYTTEGIPLQIIPLKTNKNYSLIIATYNVWRKTNIIQHFLTLNALFSISSSAIGKFRIRTTQLKWFTQNTHQPMAF